MHVAQVVRRVARVAHVHQQGDLFVQLQFCQTNEQHESESTAPAGRTVVRAVEEDVVHLDVVGRTQHAVALRMHPACVHDLTRHAVASRPRPPRRPGDPSRSCWPPPLLPPWLKQATHIVILHLPLQQNKNAHTSLVVVFIIVFSGTDDCMNPVVSEPFVIRSPPRTNPRQIANDNTDSDTIRPVNFSATNPLSRTSERQQADEEQGEKSLAVHGGDGKRCASKAV